MLEACTQLGEFCSNIKFLPCRFQLSIKCIDAIHSIKSPHLYAIVDLDNWKIPFIIIEAYFAEL